jgi:hypothetical protein
MEGGHPNRNDITNKFADNYVNFLAKGVLAWLSIGRGGGSLGKKYKSGEVVNLA